MTRDAIINRLHRMVRELETIPEDWFLEGNYPLHKVTFARRDGGPSITLVVGVEPAEDEDR